MSLESQACGTPVVGIRGSYMDEVIRHDQGWWAEEETADAACCNDQGELGDLADLGARREGCGNCVPAILPGRVSSSDCFTFTQKFALNMHRKMDPKEMPPPFTIRPYRQSDRAAVRALCCATGFLGEPIDPVFEDRELFADFLTTYYTDHEPESSFVLEIDNEIRGYLLGSRKPLQNQLYAFAQNVVLFSAHCYAIPATTRVRANSFAGSSGMAGGKSQPRRA